MLRRAVYISHPSHLPLPLKQKKDWLGVYLSRRDRSASAIRYAKSPARVSLGNVSTRNESKQQHRDSERAPLRDAHCSLVSLRYVSQRATARPASRYISTRPALPLYPHAPISPAYIPASSTVTQHASASAIRSAHPPRLRVTRRPNHLMSPNQHGFVVLRTPQLIASFLNRSAVVANATNKFDARRMNPGLPAKFRLGDGSLGDSSSSPLTRPSSRHRTSVL